MLKRFVLFAAAATLFVGAENLYAQCEGHSHGSESASHGCSSSEGKSCCSSKKAKTTNSDSPTMSMKEITLEELRTIMAAKQATIFDARDEQSYNAGHINGATHYASTQLPADKNAALVFYCGGLKCPAAAKMARKAIEQGYTNVMVFRGGWAEWSKSQI
jgi:rhodanese-related sulfurtransferase